MRPRYESRCIALGALGRLFFGLVPVVDERSDQGQKSPGLTYSCPAFGLIPHPRLSAGAPRTPRDVPGLLCEEETARGAKTSERNASYECSKRDDVMAQCGGMEMGWKTTKSARIISIEHSC